MISPKAAMISTGVIVGVMWLMLASKIDSAPRDRTSREEPVFEEQTHDSTLTIILDLSTSCEQLMSPDGQGYELMLKLIDRYFRSRLGTGDQLILAKICGNDRALLWEGTPLELRRRFRSASSFRQFLLDHADPNGSRVYAGVTRAVEYALARQGKSATEAKNACLILSDFVENDPTQKGSAGKMFETLAKYSEAGGAIGFYFVDQAICPYLEKHLAEHGIKNFCVQSEVVASPVLPNLD
jgi:hypothetical protein